MHTHPPTHLAALWAIDGAHIASSCARPQAHALLADRGQAGESRSLLTMPCQCQSGLRQSARKMGSVEALATLSRLAIHLYLTIQQKKSIQQLNPE
eukprot:1157380-Pelagomonas_calceolata.AAC.1